VTERAEKSGTKTFVSDWCVLLASLTAPYIGMGRLGFLPLTWFLWPSGLTNEARAIGKMVNSWAKISQQKEARTLWRLRSLYQTSGGHPCFLLLSKEMPIFERERKEGEKLQKNWITTSIESF